MKHGYTLSYYAHRALFARTEDGRNRLEIEAGFDRTIRGFLRDHGDPDFLYVEGSDVLHFFYIDHNLAVTFTRGGLGGQSKTELSEPIPYDLLILLPRRARILSLVTRDSTGASLTKQGSDDLAEDLSFDACVSECVVLAERSEAECSDVCAGRINIADRDIELLVPGLPVEGGSGKYTLTPEGDHWGRVESGSLSDGKSDLELVSGPSAETWLIVHVHEGASVSLETVTYARRNLVLSKWEIEKYNETRSFLTGEDLLPISRAEFFGSSGSGISDAYLTVATVERQTDVIELVAYTPGMQNMREEVNALIGSLSLRSSE